MKQPENPLEKLDHDPFDQGVINTKTDARIDTLVRPVGWLVPVVAVISA
ncbi:MAG: hypothetical protein AB8B60_08285 [Sulfitobacter sp.]